mmetsp:Transcript_30290/g.35744  ORF Transcript_30290/g.35744 Transcript_30290/m.35744 type:complete len:224 (+) Transcript_30290:120-791(+)
MKSRYSTSKRGHTSNWQEAAANRLEVASNKKVASKIQISKPLSVRKQQEKDEESNILTSEKEPSLSDLELELDNLMKKLETENASIEEAKVVRSSHRDYRHVIAHAKREKKPENSSSFFITGVDAGGHCDEEVSDIKKQERYPNYNKEIVLAMEAQATTEQKKMARIELQTSKLQQETRNSIASLSNPGLKSKPKKPVVTKTQKQKDKRKSVESLLPSIKDKY